MNENVKSSIEEYQCAGCTCGSDTGCGNFKQETTTGWRGVECTAHVAGTTVFSKGQLYREFLGLPKGFNRCHNMDNTKIVMYETLEQYGSFDVFNVPVWKHLNDAGHTLVRMFSPRQNRSTVLIFLQNCIDKIECQLITDDMIEAMD